MHLLQEKQYTVGKYIFTVSIFTAKYINVEHYVPTCMPQHVNIMFSASWKKSESAVQFPLLLHNGLVRSISFTVWEDESTAVTLQCFNMADLGDNNMPTYIQCVSDMYGSFRKYLNKQDGNYTFPQDFYNDLKKYGQYSNTEVYNVIILSIFFTVLRIVLTKAVLSVSNSLQYSSHLIQNISRLFLPTFPIAEANVERRKERLWRF